MLKLKAKRHGKEAALILNTNKDSKKGNMATFDDAETVKKTLEKLSRHFLPRHPRAATLKHD